MEIVETRKGGSALIYRGYQYRRRRENKDKSVVWQCIAEKSRMCKGKLVSLNDEVKSVTEHQCAPDELALDVRKALLRAKRRAREETNTSIRKIFKDEFEPLHTKEYNLTTTELPQFECVKGMLYRTRRIALAPETALYPKRPKLQKSVKVIKDAGLSPEPSTSSAASTSNIPSFTYVDVSDVCMETKIKEEQESEKSDTENEDSLYSFSSVNIKTEIKDECEENIISNEISNYRASTLQDNFYSGESSELIGERVSSNEPHEKSEDKTIPVVESKIKIENVFSSVSNCDENYMFGVYVANTLKSFKLESSRQRLKSLIHKAIAEVSVTDMASGVCGAH